MDTGTVSVLADIVTATAVLTGVSAGLLLHLVNQGTVSFWHVARVYSLGMATGLGLAVVTFSVTPYVSFPGMVLFSYLVIVITIAVNLYKIIWDWRGSLKRSPQS